MHARRERENVVFNDLSRKELEYDAEYCNRHSAPGRMGPDTLQLELVLVIEFPIIFCHVHFYTNDSSRQ